MFVITRQTYIGCKCDSSCRVNRRTAFCMSSLCNFSRCNNFTDSQKALCQFILLLLWMQFALLFTCTASHRELFLKYMIWAAREGPLNQKLCVASVGSFCFCVHCWRHQQCCHRWLRSLVQARAAARQESFFFLNNVSKGKRKRGSHNRALGRAALMLCDGLGKKSNKNHFLWHRVQLKWYLRRRIEHGFHLYICVTCN